MNTYLKGFIAGRIVVELDIEDDSVRTLEYYVQTVQSFPQEYIDGYVDGVEEALGTKHTCAEAA